MSTSSNLQTAHGTLVLATSDICSTFLNLGKVTELSANSTEWKDSLTWRIGCISWKYQCYVLEQF
jgi:hypothetical protein